MYCKNCGKEIENDSKFCKYCGCKFDERNNKEEIIQRYNLILTNVGDDKVKVTKTISEITGLRLVEAEDVVDNLPKCIIPNLSYDRYKKYEQLFIDCGASVDYKVYEQKITRKQNNGNNLKKCPVCGGSVSKSAKTCPKCGHPLVKNNNNNSNQGMSFGSMVGAIIVAVLILMFL